MEFTQKTFGNIFDTPQLLEIYEVLLLMKDNISTEFIVKDDQIIYQRINTLSKYHLIDDLHAYLMLTAKHNKQQYWNSYYVYSYIKTFEINIMNIKHTKFGEYLLREQLDKHYMNIADQLSKIDLLSLKQLLYSVRILMFYQETQQSVQDIEWIKQIERMYALLSNTITEINEAKEFKIKVTPREIPIFSATYPQIAQIIAISSLIIKYISTKQYDKFAELNYEYQTELVPKLNEQCKGHSIFSQFWKLQSLMIDVTQNIVNLIELFAITPQSFKEEGAQRMAFSFSNITRGFKVLRIILEEMIFKQFLEVMPGNRLADQDNSDFKPEIKIIFHGLEELNLSNPKSTQLNLEILIQTGVNQFVSLNEKSSELLFWNYDKIRNFNLLLQCIQVWIKFLPKSTKDYQEWIYQRVQSLKLDVDRSYITQWISQEKQGILNSIDSMTLLLESLELQVLKTDGTLQRDYLYYQKGGLVTTLKQDKFTKSIIQSGLRVDYDLVNNLSKKLSDGMKSQIDLALTQVKPQQIMFKNLMNQAKKLQLQYCK